VTPRLLAVDLDGTLLDLHGQPHAVDVSAIAALRQTGAVVTILTGRMYSATRPTADVLGLDGPVGCIDGSHLVLAGSHETLFHLGIAGVLAEGLREILVRAEVATFVFSRDTLLHDDAGDPYLPYMETWCSSMQRTPRVHEHASWSSKDGVTAAVSVGTGAQIQKAHAELDERLNGAAYVASFPLRRLGDQWGMIARAAGGTKGSALSWIASHHGIALSDTVVVGDWINDVPMFACAGRSFAMGQAPAHVKSAATDVLDVTVADGGGVARAIREAFGVDVLLAIGQSARYYLKVTFIKVSHGQLPRCPPAA
jgi:Cof subfamily protein (haloacid dehalogenase superfamily)